MSLNDPSCGWKISLYCLKKLLAISMVHILSHLLQNPFFHVRVITLFLDQNAENADDFDDQYSHFSETGQSSREK